MCWLEIKDALANADPVEMKYLCDRFMEWKYFIEKPNKEQEIILDILVKHGVLSETDDPVIDEPFFEEGKTYISLNEPFFTMYFQTCV